MQRRDAAPWLAAGLMAAGLILTGYTLSHMSGWLSLLEKRQDDLAALERIRAQRERDESAIHRYEALASTTPTPLQNLCTQSGIPTPPEVKTSGSTPLLDGWMLTSSDLSFSDVRLADIGRLLQFARDQRPPWILQGCQITALDDAGRARVSLSLQALSRQNGDSSQKRVVTPQP